MTTSLSFKLACASTLLGLSSIAAAQPAIVYDMGGKFDKSFNEAAYNGAERWKKETGKPYLDFEIANEAQREQAMRRMAERGANPVIGVGFSQASTIEKVAKEFPKLELRDHRFGGQAAQRRVDRVQGAGGQLPGRHDGGAGQQDRQGRASSAAWTSR